MQWQGWLGSRDWKLKFLYAHCRILLFIVGGVDGGIPVTTVTDRDEGLARPCQLRLKEISAIMWSSRPPPSSLPGSGGSRPGLSLSSLNANLSAREDIGAGAGQNFPSGAQWEY